MSLNWQELLSLHFWFTSQPGVMNDVIIKIMLIFFAALIFFALILSLIKARKGADNLGKKLIGKWQSFLATMGFVGLILVFFFFEQVYLFSARFWLIGWIIGAGVWLYFVFHYWLKEMPRRRAEKVAKGRFEQYLPRKK